PPPPHSTRFPYTTLFRSSLKEGLLLAIVVVLLLLIANFQSIRDSLLVLATVPGVLAGVVVAMIVTRSTFNVQSMMGAIMSIGVRSEEHTSELQSRGHLVC